MFARTYIFVICLFGSAWAQNPNCDFARRVQAGMTYYVYNIQYPNNYTAGSQCRWVGYADSGYNCRLDCPEINLPYTSGCTLDRLLVSKSGDPQLNAADKYCGVGSLTAVSTQRNISVGLIASNNSPGGRFYCRLTAQPATPTPTPCSCGYKKTTRIVGGQPTGINEYPMMVGLADRSISTIKCGAVIISPRHVLTAAHCMQGKTVSDFAVVVGEHDVTTGDSPATKAYEIAQIIRHPQYNSNTYDNDIAILKITRDIDFSDRVGPVCLPFKYAGYDFTGAKVTALGWGTLFPGGPDSTVLRKVDLDVISQASCRQKTPQLTERQMCTFTQGKDACQDDSGGPLLYQDPSNGLFYHAGIISFGRFCASGYPGINTRITALLPWIQQNTENYNFCVK